MPLGPHPTTLSAVVTMVLLAVPAVVRAQCPDGSPPPCRGAAPARRPNPPLDERTWIVVPFENVTRAADIDWLREASVNLLYLDMSRWRDIRVIDDERVADLLREVPQARGGAGLSLDAGIAVARRAGAGKLVMGDLLKVGSRTRVVAKVFDVRTGQRVRNVIRETASPDSLMGLFSQLARGILNADPPGEAALGTVGTSRLDAYQAYLAGVRALNAFALDTARAQLERALALDSTFALAHYKLSLVIGWLAPNDPAQRRHAEAGARLSAALPARERTLIAAQAQAAATLYARACELLEPLVRSDSSDVEAWYGYGECLYHDNTIVPLPPDSSRGVFRGDWNASMRAFRRVLQLDPTYHLAFQHIQDVSQATARQGCPAGADGRPACEGGTSLYGAAVRRAGDSLLLEPVRLGRAAGAVALARQQEEAVRDGSRRRGLEESRRAAEEWLAAGPTESRALVAYVRALLRLGRIEEAAAVARRVAGTHSSVQEAGLFAIDRVELALKSDDAPEAARILDSIRVRFDTVPDVQGLMALIGAVLGRTQPLDSLLVRQLAQSPPAVRDYFRAATRVAMGLQVDSFIALERAFADFATPAQGAARAAALLAPGLALGPLPRGAGEWPPTDSAASDPRAALVAVIAAGDTGRIRARLLAFDSASSSRRDDPDRGEALLSAKAWLILGDSARALTRMRFWRDVTLRVTPLADPVGPGFILAGMLWPRSHLLLAELAAALGHGDEAAQAYRRFIAMWATGDAEAQRRVARARQQLAALAH